MDFGDYDVLDDILSDGSNDSFFEDPKLKTKASNSQKTTETKKESKLDDLAGIERSSKSVAPDSKGKIDWLGLDKNDNADTEKNDPLPRARRTSKKISFEDDDILSTLGFNDKSEKGKKSEVPTTHDQKDKKIDILEGILKTNINEKPADSTIASGTGHISSINNASNQMPNFPREGRRRRVSPGLVDPLGLFSDQPSDELVKAEIDGKQTRTRSFSSGDTKDVDTISSTKSQFGDNRSAPNLLESHGTPDWLGLAPKQKSSENDKPSLSYTKSKSDITLSDRSEQSGNPTKTSMKSQGNSEPDQNNLETSSFNASNASLMYEKLTKSQMDFQSTSVSLQQQESQILMALQMKKYEDSLMEIQRQQQEIIMKQDQQFSALLERQFAKQQAMESGLKLQQERINNHIQLLLTQPRVEAPISHLREEIDKTRESVEEEYLKANENLISNLKQRHHEELFILEESYKKQISLLEDSSQQIEARLKSELESVFTQHEMSTKALKENHEKDLQAVRKKYEDSEKQHVEELKLVRDNHLRVVDEMKYEHNLLLENLKESRRQEASVTRESGEYGKMLDANIQLLHNNSQILQSVSGKVETQYDVVYSTREESLRAKEKEIEMMRNTLDKCRESAEMERSYLMGLVRSLETKIAELNQTTREERWAMQQAVSTLAARSAAFDREMEFSRASIEREREQLKTLKEAVSAEQEKMMLQITEEKLSMTAERSRIQTSNKLNFQYDTQRAKAELEAAIQVAKEAAEMTDQEREILQRRITEVESLKRTLKDKERKMASREDELNELIQTSEHKYQDGERALKDARITESKCNEKMRLLQSQLLQLAAREKKISEQQIALSKERLAMNTLMRQRQNCRLCSAEGPTSDQHRDEWNNELNSEDVDIPPRFDITEAEIFRLQFENKEEEPRNTTKYL